MKKAEDLRAKWAAMTADKLVGRKIVAVRYMTEKEMGHFMWEGAAIVLQLDDGNVLFPSADDEGNGPGALFTNDDDLPTIPVI